MPSFEVQIQQELADMKGVKISDETLVTAAQMSLHLEIASGMYQEEGLGFKRDGPNCHLIEDSFLFGKLLLFSANRWFVVVTDADSDEKTENLPMILAHVQK